MKTNDPTFSVLICTYNRHALLEKVLQSVVRGTDEKPSEVVVVNGGDERADRVVQAFAHEPATSVILVKTRNINLATSRTLGLSHCTGELIAMTDDDAEVFPDWVTQMKRVHAEQPDAGAVGGPVIGTNTDSLVGKVADLTTFACWPEARDVRTLPGVNVSYKRDVVERIGAQDAALFRGEDVDYNWRVLQAGYRVLFDPRIRVYHYHRPTLRGFLDQHYMYGRAYYLVRRKWPAMYCVYPHRFRRPKDGLKLVNCVAAPLYQPFLSSRPIRSLPTRLAALPLLFLSEVAWKAGMANQACRELSAAGSAHVPSAANRSQ